MTITRAEVLQRARTVWPYQGVPYSQSTIHRPDGYRQDCSGYVSMCWDIPLDAPGSWGGMNTVSLVTDGWMYEINPNDLKPGDAIGKCGPGTAGNDGHVQLFTHWLTTTDHNDSHYYCLEQTGSQRGPHETLHDWPSGYKAYRFKGIVDDDAATPPPVIVPIANPVSDNTTEAIVGKLPTLQRGSKGHYVSILQGLLYGHGYGTKVDGDFGPSTEADVRRFQGSRGLSVDGVVGTGQTWPGLLDV